MDRPKTLREKYERELEKLYKDYDALGEAVSALISGRVQSYTLGNRSLTYANIKDLRALMDDAAARIDALEAKLSHRPPRNVSTNVFLDPSIIRGRR